MRMEMKAIIAKLKERPLYQKWAAGIAAFIVGMFVIREIFFWSAFNSVLSQIRQENQAIQEKQAQMHEEAVQMKQQMDDKVKDFQDAFAQETDKMSKTAGDITSSGLEAESKMAEVGSSELDDKIRDQNIENRILRSKQDDIRSDVLTFHDKSKSSIEFPPEDLQIIKQLIAEYLKSHPDVMQRPGAPEVLKLSPREKIALIQLIRDFINNRLLPDEEERAGRPIREARQKIHEDFRQGMKDFNEKFNKQLEEMNKETQRIGDHVPGEPDKEELAGKAGAS